MLASKFGRSRVSLRSPVPLNDDQIMAIAPSIFAAEKHESRSDRYAYIPTIRVLDALRKEGFSPFEVAQTKARDISKREHTKHMVRLRHANQINGAEANEIILLNSHDGTSSYQLLAGKFRFVCANGLVRGDTLADVRVRHQGDVVDNCIEGAIKVLNSFDEFDEQCSVMKGLTLDQGEREVFANSALLLKYDDQEKGAPVTATDVLRPKRTDDGAGDLWTTFNVVQEHLIKGGDVGRSGRRVTRTRPVQGIDSNVKLNRALFALAEGMRKLKGA